jgi:hypothetical protein
MNQILLLESFQRALVGCCSVCVTKAFGFTLKLRVSPYMRPMPLDSILYITCSSAYEFLKVSAMLDQSLSVNSVARGTPLIFDFPPMLVKNIQQVEVNVIDSLL